MFLGKKCKHKCKKDWKCKGVSGLSLFSPQSSFVFFACVFIYLFSLALNMIIF